MQLLLHRLLLIVFWFPLFVPRRPFLRPGLPLISSARAGPIKLGRRVDLTFTASAWATEARNSSINV